MVVAEDDELLEVEDEDDDVKMATEDEDPDDDVKAVIGDEGFDDGLDEELEEEVDEIVEELEYEAVTISILSTFGVIQKGKALTSNVCLCLNAGSEGEHQEENTSGKHLERLRENRNDSDFNPNKENKKCFSHEDRVMIGGGSRIQNHNNSKSRYRTCTALPKPSPSHCQPSGRLFPPYHPCCPGPEASQPEVC